MLQFFSNICANNNHQTKVFRSENKQISSQQVGLYLSKQTKNSNFTLFGRSKQTRVNDLSLSCTAVAARRFSYRFSALSCSICPPYSCLLCNNFMSPNSNYFIVWFIIFSRSRFVFFVKTSLFPVQFRIISY